jgi:hypothetical protein
MTDAAMVDFFQKCEKLEDEAQSIAQKNVESVETISGGQADDEL